MKIVIPAILSLAILLTGTAFASTEEDDVINFEAIYAFFDKLGAMFTIGDDSQRITELEKENNQLRQDLYEARANQVTESDYHTYMKRLNLAVGLGDGYLLNQHDHGVEHGVGYSAETIDTHMKTVEEKYDNSSLPQDKAYYKTILVYMKDRLDSGCEPHSHGHNDPRHYHCNYPPLDLNFLNKLR